MKIGDRWLHLRVCLTLRARSAAATTRRTSTPAAHAAEVGHPIVRSAEPGETWCWCFVDEVAFEVEFELTRVERQSGRAPRYRPESAARQHRRARPRAGAAGPGGGSVRYCGYLVARASRPATPVVDVEHLDPPQQLDPGELGPVVVVVVDAERGLRAAAQPADPGGLGGALRLAVDRAPDRAVGRPRRSSAGPAGDRRRRTKASRPTRSVVD